ncbi:hypothetical protein NEOLEDRAFT_1201999 [Neolentinus lepideus HHB14362 ss-1]|uniref:Uncharacterized protein n=1 Tax=Neolentinus lepideus HHB14362 ss-1 TaxID=1314782 RepID=A0A165SUH1_9AGAM|nr:hypothetical protein NEOLEDRAFT_1201999 [Neolentinus lepideus HHB14362 ss-1]
MSDDKEVSSIPEPATNSSRGEGLGTNEEAPQTNCECAATPVAEKKAYEAAIASPEPDARASTRKRSADALEDNPADCLPPKSVEAQPQPEASTEIQKTTGPQAPCQTQEVARPEKRKYRPRAPLRPPTAATKPQGSKPKPKPRRTDSTRQEESRL